MAPSGAFAGFTGKTLYTPVPNPVFGPILEQIQDLAELTRIYNHYITHTAITFDVTTCTPEQRRPWLTSFLGDGPHRCFVADLDGPPIGWACSGRFREKAAYDLSLETSIYLDPSATGRGLGTVHSDDASL